jgi:hypothetical protein
MSTLIAALSCIVHSWIYADSAADDGFRESPPFDIQMSRISTLLLQKTSEDDFRSNIVGKIQTWFSEAPSWG